MAKIQTLLLKKATKELNQKLKQGIFAGLI